jgi:hypothetical protein
MNKKINSNLCFHLPSIRNKQKNNISRQTSQQKLEFTNEENDQITVTALDQWNADNKTTAKSSKTLAAIQRTAILQNDFRQMPTIQTSEVI